MNFLNKTREGICSDNERECSNISLYTAEQNAPIIERKIKSAKTFLDKKINEIKKKINNLVKKENYTKKLINKNTETIIKVKKEL